MTSSIVHSRYRALELEFYVPAAIWDAAATRALLNHVYSLMEGVTLVGGAKGIWRGQTETTHLARVLIRRDDARSADLLSEIESAVTEFMLSLANNPDLRQSEFLFTVRELTLHESRWAGQ